MKRVVKLRKFANGDVIDTKSKTSLPKSVSSPLISGQVGENENLYNELSPLSAEEMRLLSNLAGYYANGGTTPYELLNPRYVYQNPNHGNLVGVSPNPIGVAPDNVPNHNVLDENMSAGLNPDGTIPTTQPSLKGIGIQNQLIPNYNEGYSGTPSDYFNGQIIQGGGSYSQYNEEGDPTTVWKNTEEADYNKMIDEQDRNKTNPYDVIGAGLSIAGADIDTDGALFKLGQSLNFNADKFAPEYKNVARVGNVARFAGALGKTILAGARNINAGAGYQNRLQNFKEWNDAKEVERAKGHYQVVEDGGIIQFLANGGRIEDIITPEMLMSGNYTTGVKAGQPANAEVENGEYLQHPDGAVQQVVGKSHENGGEAMMLEPGTKVVSDNLKLGKELSKDINATFDLKTKANDTYAKAIDKFKKKNGLDKLEDEEENLLKRAEKNEKVSSATTKSLNKEHLSKQFKELEEEKASAQEMLSQFTDFIFQAQQQAKGEYDQMSEGMSPEAAMPTEEELQMLQQQSAAQQGEEAVQAEADMQQQQQQAGEVMSNGGLFEDPRFLNLVKQSGLSPERASQLYQTYRNGGYAGLEKFADGGKPKRETKNLKEDADFILEMTKKDPEFAKEFATFFKYMRLNPYALIERDTQHYNKNSNLYGGIEDTADARMNWLYDKNEDLLDFYETDKNGKRRVKKGKEGEYQKKYAELSDKWVNRLVKKGLWTEKQAQMFKDYIAYHDAKDTARGFDSKVGDFTSSRSFLGVPIFKTEEERKAAEGAGIFTLKQFRKAWEKDKDKLIKLGISEESFNNAKTELEENGDLDMGMYSLEPQDPPQEPKETPEEPEEPKETPVPAKPEEPARRRGEEGVFDWLLFPDQTPLPPDGVVPHLMVDRTYERLDPVRISYEPQMVEGQRQLAQLQDSVASLPETARAAVLANAMASTQQNLNNAIGQVQLANQQNEMQTEQFNIGQSNMEENARAQDLLNFEQRQLMAYENTLRDYNDWFEKVQNNYMNEYQTRLRMQQINQLTDNFKTDMFGKTREIDTGEKFSNNSFALNYERLAAEMLKQQSEAELAKAKAKAKAAEVEHKNNEAIVSGAIGKYTKR